MRRCARFSSPEGRQIWKNPTEYAYSACMREQTGCSPRGRRPLEGMYQKRSDAIVFNFDQQLPRLSLTRGREFSFIRWDLKVPHWSQLAFIRLNQLLTVFVVCVTLSLLSRLIYLNYLHSERLRALSCDMLPARSLGNPRDRHRVEKLVVSASIPASVRYTVNKAILGTKDAPEERKYRRRSRLDSDRTVIVMRSKRRTFCFPNVLTVNSVGLRMPAAIMDSDDDLIDLDGRQRCTRGTTVARL